MLAPGQFWSGPPEDKGRLLRPDWLIWLNNMAWISELVQKGLTDGPSYYKPDLPTSTKDFYDSLTAPELEKAIRKYWNTLHAKYTDRLKPDSVSSKKIPDNRRRTRKAKVSPSFVQETTIKHSPFP